MSDHKSTAFTYTGRIEDKIVTIIGFCPKIKYLKLVFAYNEIFYRRIEVRDDIWYCTLFFIGSKEDSSRYNYRISFEEEGNDAGITYTQVARCMGEDVDEIYRQSKCVKLPYDVVAQFIESGNLKHKMEIFENLKI